MKKKRILKGVLIVILLLAAFFAKAVYDEVKRQQRTGAILNDITSKKVELKDIDYSSLGKYGTFVKEFGEYYIKLDSDKNNFEAEINKFENYDIIDLKYIKDPEEGKKQVKQYADTYSKMDILLNEDFDNLQKVFESAPIPSKQKEEIKKKFTEDVPKILNEYKSLSNNVQATKTASETLFDFLISIKGKYTIEKDEIIFDYEKDLEKFRELEKAVLANGKNMK
jgi:hypothetical protein